MGYDTRQNRTNDTAGLMMPIVRFSFVDHEAEFEFCSLSILGDIERQLYFFSNSTQDAKANKRNTFHSHCRPSIVRNDIRRCLHLREYSNGTSATCAEKC